MKQLYALIALLALISATASAQWTQSNGPYGATGTVIGKVGSALLLGTESSGLFKSTDNGTHWTQFFPKSKFGIIRAMAVDTPYVYIGSAYGFYRSTDAGTSWTRELGNLSSFSLSSMSVWSFMLSGSTLNMGIGNRLLRSADHGLTWAAADSGLPRENVYSIAYSKSSLVAGLNNKGAYYSLDDGATWNRSDSTTIQGTVNSLLSLVDVNLVGWPPMPVFTNYLYASTPSGVYRSLDGASSWTKTNTGLPTRVGKLTAGISGTTQAIFFGCIYGVYRSTDWGTSWSFVLGSSLDNETVNEVYDLGNDNLVACSFPHGALKSTDGGATFAASNSGMNGAWIHAVSIIDSTFFASTHGDGIYASTDFGASWHSLPTPGGMSATAVSLLGVRFRTIFPHPTTVRHLYAATWGAGIWRSTDLGQTWVPSDSGLTTKFAGPLSMVPGVVNYTLYAATLSGVGVSHDGGWSWTISKPSPSDSSMNGAVYAGGVLFAGASGGTSYKSTDDGATWTPFMTGRTKIVIRSMITIDTTVYLADPNGIFSTTPSSDTWTSIPLGFYSNSLRRLLQVQNGLVALGTDGAWHLPAGSTTWTQIAPSVEDYDFFDGASYNDLLVVGAYAASLQFTHFGQLITSAPETKEEPGAFALMQNYPNPFNPVTQINYTVGQGQDYGTVGLGEGGRRVSVQLIVYDVLGREVRTLVNEHQAPGHYTVRFDGAGLSSGVYFYRLQAGGTTQTRRMMLLR